MTDKMFITLEVDDKGSAVVKQFTSKTVNQVKRMTDRSIGHVKRLTKKFTVGLGRAIKKVGGALVSLKTMAITAMAGWGIVKVLGQFATFESALADMGKVTSESFDSIKKKIMDLPAALGSATQLVQGYYNVISAGVKGAAEQIDTLITASKQAKTAHADQGQVILGLTSVMDAFKVKSMEAADTLQVIEKTGKTTVGGLIPIIGELSSGSAALGISLNAMGAAFAGVTLQSGGTEKAATQYKALLISLLAPSKDMIKLLDEYGGAQKAIKDIGFGGVLKLIQDATNGNAAATKSLLGSAEAYLGFLGASANQMATYNQNLEEQKNKTGAVDKAWKDYMKTLNAIWDTVKNIIGKQVILIGEKLAPAVKKMITVAGEWLAKHREFITLKFEGWINDALGGIARFVEGVAGVVESLYKLKVVGHETISWLAKVGGVLIDVAAGFGLLDPINAFKASIFGLRETFPMLAEMRDKFDAIGASHARSALEAENGRQKFAEYGDQIRAVADEVRKLIAEENNAGKTASKMADAHSNAANKIEALKPKFKIDPVANTQLDEVKKKAADTANAIESMKPTFSVQTAAATTGMTGMTRLPIKGSTADVETLRRRLAEVQYSMQKVAPVPGSRYISAGYSALAKGLIAQISRLEAINARVAAMTPTFQTGTGPEGLPRTGLFHGHKGEIVKSPEESDKERRGVGGDTYYITVAPRYMTGDSMGVRRAAEDLERELIALKRRRGG